MPTVGPRRTALFWTAGVTLLLLVPLPAVFGDLRVDDLGGIPYDKLAHVLLFVPLAWAWLDLASPRRRSARAVAIAVALALWGGVLELVQGATGWRSAEWADFAADALGAALGCLLPSGWPLARSQRPRF